MTSPVRPTPRTTEPPPSVDDERSQAYRRWLAVAGVLAAGAALGTIVVTRFPASIGVGILGLLAVAAAVKALGYRARTDDGTPGAVPPRRGGNGAAPPVPGRARPAPGPGGDAPGGHGPGGYGHGGPPPGGSTPAGNPEGRPGHGTPAGRARQDDRPRDAKGAVDRTSPAEVERRRRSSAVFTIVLGSMVAVLQLSPVLAWGTAVARQDCLDSALTNQARVECEQAFRQDLRGLLGQ